MESKHGHSLADDLPLFENQLQSRRQALRMMMMSGATALLSGCGGGTGGTAETTPTTPTTSTAACVVGSSETNGPYPADGTNTSSGSTSNVLTLASAMRSDIRASFLNTSTVAPGVRMDLTVKLVNVANSCAALSSYVIYLWHCDALGKYSLYDLPNESYLRGIQVTDANGQVTFTTIFPGAYGGRYPHIHFEVFSSLAAATSGRSALLVSQFALPAAQSQAVYADTAVYGNSAARFPQTPLASDNVFGDNTAAQIAQQTIALSGAPGSGYTGSVLVGVNG